jgi:hypothetical protein
LYDKALLPEFKRLFFTQKTVLNAGFRDFWSDPDLLLLFQLVAFKAEKILPHTAQMYNLDKL